jgi:hypothetical protein
VKEWLNETGSFFINYSDYKNEKEVAIELLNKYESQVIKYLSNDKIKYLEYITIVMICMSGLIVYSELKRCFK